LTERRVVVVSNRVPPPETGRRESVGGLVSALRPALEERGGLWFGWSGRTGDSTGVPAHRSEGAVEYVTVDLAAEEVTAYYEGFCNRTLWPLMHGLPERAEVRDTEYEVWRRVNARFASCLAPLLAPSDLVWVHDYQLIALGAELRLAGWRGALGYFHHIPIPRDGEWTRIPHAEAIAADFEAYDLVGVQTDRDAKRLRGCMPEAARGRIAAFSIGIDPARIRALAQAHPADPFTGRAGRQVLLGLDRLDYSKGIPDRLMAFEDLLTRAPVMANAALLVQWAAPSRESITDYQLERRQVEEVVARISALGAPPPVELRFEVLPAEQVAAGLRDADVCLVTSLSDGMNLVAKEFVAVQRPEHPGVLVLSDGCGAAEELTESVIVPSGDRTAIREAMGEALAMPIQERRARWEALSAKVERGNVSAWCRAFLDALERAAAPDSSAD
jgi:trehalose 6-phosphate synthase